MYDICIEGTSRNQNGTCLDSDGWENYCRNGVRIDLGIRDRGRIREEGTVMVQPGQAQTLPRPMGLWAYIIPELSTKDLLQMNRSQIALIVNTDLTDTSAVFNS